MRARLSLGLLLITLALANSAGASIIGLNVSVAFDDDLGFPPETDVVTVVDPGPEIETADGTNIGDVILLPDEFIDIGPLLGGSVFTSGFSIVYQVRGGGDPHPADPNFQTTGFGPNASLAFSGLDSPITAIDVVLLNVIGVSLGDVSFTSSGATILLGDVGVGAVTDLGTIRVDFQVPGTTPVPEPSTLALLVIGLLAAGAGRRTR
jgi:hypothetical protein